MRTVPLRLPVFMRGLADPCCVVPPVSVPVNEATWELELMVEELGSGRPAAARASDETACKGGDPVGLVVCETAMTGGGARKRESKSNIGSFMADKWNSANDYTATTTTAYALLVGVY